jgi:hypothetical protein
MDWANRAPTKWYVQPRYVAGKGNQHTKSAFMKLWAYDQLDEVLEKFKEFDKSKAWWHESRNQENYPEVRAKKNKEYKANSREKKKQEEVKPKPVPLEKPSYTPPSDEALDYADEFHRDREDAAMRFLIEKGLV